MLLPEGNRSSAQQVTGQMPAGNTWLDSFVPQALRKQVNNIIKYSKMLIISSNVL
jgi:hypothetical protein